MEIQKPTIGRIVHYVLSDRDVEMIQRRRVENASKQENWVAGAQAHVGNPVQIGQHLPMIVCIVWPDEYGQDFDGVNGQVLLDGNDQYWVTSIKQDEGEDTPSKPFGTWHWPERI